MHKKDAFVSVTPLAFRIVPAGITNSPPSTTKTLPEIVHILSAVSVFLDDISPLKTKLPVMDAETVAMLLSDFP